MADWDTARAIAALFPGAEESTSYGQPAFKVRKRLFAPGRAPTAPRPVHWPRTSTKPGEELLVVRDPSSTSRRPTTTAIRSSSPGSSSRTALHCASGSRTPGSCGRRGCWSTPTWPAPGRPRGASTRPASSTADAIQHAPTSATACASSPCRWGMSRTTNAGSRSTGARGTARERQSATVIVSSPSTAPGMKKRNIAISGGNTPSTASASAGRSKRPPTPARTRRISNPGAAVRPASRRRAGPHPRRRASASARATGGRTRSPRRKGTASPGSRTSWRGSRGSRFSAIQRSRSIVSECAGSVANAATWKPAPSTSVAAAARRPAGVKPRAGARREVGRSPQRRAECHARDHFHRRPVRATPGGTTTARSPRTSRSRP